MKIREVIAFKNYFEDFLKGQSPKVQDKIFKIIEAIETLERVPSNYLKHLVGTEGLLLSVITKAEVLAIKTQRNWQQ